MTGPLASSLRWDIFCKVIDNHGDMGVTWRLARQLAGHGHSVRLWVDDASALAWMAPGGCPGVEVRPWVEPLGLTDLPAGDVLVEAFGCDVPPEFVAQYVQWRSEDQRHPTWINLEYLSAERYVERSHGLPSPVMRGPARGFSKRFYYPGFTPRTGGLLREPDLMERQARFDRARWLSGLGLPWQAGQRYVSLFCYEPAALPSLLQGLAQTPTHLLVTAGRAAAAVRTCTLPAGLHVHYLPYLTQDDYDHLLWASDLNFVRGEDSLVRALWAGRPFIWHIYPQHDDAHHAKLDAFLDWMEAPSSLRAFHAVWNGLTTGDLPDLDLAAWTPCSTQARELLLAQPDLLSQLLALVAHLRHAP